MFMLNWFGGSMNTLNLQYILKSILRGWAHLGMRNWVNVSFQCVQMLSVIVFYYKVSHYTFRNLKYKVLNSSAN